MKYAQTLASLGLLSLSVSLYAQQGVQKPATPPPDPNAPQNSLQVPTQAPAPGTQPGTQPADQPTGIPGTAGAAPAVPGEPAAVQDLDPNYVLGVDDAIMVHVWKEPTISGPLLIRPDGRISLPLVGDLPASGMTPMALSAEIADHLKTYINEPSVTVTVTATNSRRVFFIGEVVRQGPILMTRDMTMLQAISAAGGLTPYANKSHIVIQRVEKGKTIRIKFNYKKALNEGDEQGVTLHPGDTIHVP
jgi:polysaccharide export outer membrane protein